MPDRKRPPRYAAFVVLGIALLAVGIATKVYPISAAGFVFIIIGLVNRDKWTSSRGSADDGRTDERPGGTP